MSVKKRPGSNSTNLFFADKKAQVTVFIIVGIVILFTLAAILALNKFFLKESLVTESSQVFDSVPLDFLPLKEFTDSCLLSVGERGLAILGEQGGYIYPDLLGSYSELEPTDSDGISIGETDIPYWYYNIINNAEKKIEYSSLKPELYFEDDAAMSIEAQLSRYVEENLDNCLNDFSSFVSQGFQVEYSAELNQVEVKVRDESVDFFLTTDIEAEIGSSESQINRLFASSPVKLKQIYATASEIADMQAEHNFLELQAMDLIVTYSGIDPNYLPPTDELTFEKLPKIYWNVEDVQSKVEEMLLSNVPLLRYYGSDNFYRYDYLANRKDVDPVLDLTELYQKSYDDMVLPLELGQGLNVNFNYFDWPIYFDMGDTGGTIRPSHFSINFLRLNFAVQNYYNNYDISYPVLVTLEDQSAFDGKGFFFNFALESNLRNNAAVPSGYVEPTPVSAVKSMVCDEDKHGTELLKTIVVDSATREPLEAVQIGFSIPGVDDCIMGETDKNGEFTDSYPEVYGGVGAYMKEGYLTDFYPLDTAGLDSSAIIGYAVADFSERVIEMHPYYKVNVSVQAKNLYKCIDDRCFSQGLLAGGEEVFAYSPQMLDQKHSWHFTNVATPLRGSETATLTLTRVGSTEPGVYNDEFVAFANPRGAEPVEMELVPGVYKVNIIVHSNEELVIPKDERCRRGLIRRCVDFDDVVVEEMLVGMALWEDQYVTITPEQLYSSDKMTFYVAGINLLNVPEGARIVEDMEAIGILSQLSQDLRDELEPSYG